MLSRLQSDPLAFELKPAMLVSALILFERFHRGPIWVAAHERASATLEVATGTRVVRDEAVPSSSPASSGSEEFVELAYVPADRSGTELSRFRIGEAPAGFLTVVSAPSDIDVTGKVFTLVVVGERTGFLTFGG